VLELLVVAASLLGYALVSRRLALSPVTGPMVFTTIGLIVGDFGLGWFDLELDGEAASILIETTLVLVLFSDAARIDLRALRVSAALPTRLLGLGLPLTMVAGAIAAHLVLGLPAVAAALLAATLAPTDAALGQAIVSDRRLPVRIRQTLNVESGLNDGIVLPVVTVLLVVAEASEQASMPGGLVGFVAAQLVFAVAVGALAGGVGGVLLTRAVDRDRVERVYRQIGVLALALLAYAGATLIGGNGFIAAFVGGMVLGHVVGNDDRSDVQDFTEDESELLTVTTFLVFGAVLVGPLLTDVTWQVVLYVLLSLTVVRMVPVLLVLVGSQTRWESRLFLGWFGPRGLASILFTLLIAQDLADDEAVTTVLTAAVLTVLASVYAHGLTASPWSRRLAHVLATGSADQPELVEVPELPARRRLG
jgi:sodium/hydrogen antiporter